MKHKAEERALRGTYRAYVFGCGQPVRGGDVAYEQMRGRVALWNRLVEFEREHQQRLETLLCETSPDYAALAGVPWAELDGQARADWRALRAAALKSAQSGRSAVEAERRLAVKRLCRESGLYWCNYEQVVERYEAARRKPGELRFHAWRRVRGTVTVRYQNGLPASELFGDDTRLQVSPEPYVSERWLRAARKLAGTKHAPATPRARLARLRVGSIGRLPSWLELPVVLHRPLPAGSLIRTASVLRERIGTHIRWSLVLTVGDISPCPADPVRAGRLALDVGWRRMADGDAAPCLRVAVGRGDDGRAWELRLPADWLEQWQTVEDLRSIRDHAINRLRESLGGWLAATAESPAWLREQTRYLGRWRSAGRFSVLAREWRLHRFAGDEAVYGELEAWRKRDRHLCEWEANLRDQLLSRRRDIYRTFALRVARAYRELHLESFDLRGVARVRDNGQARELAPEARHQRVLAGLSVLRGILAHTCEREGTVLTLGEAKDTTQQCSQCEHVNRLDKRPLVLRCAACDASWDQDENAARNLLAQPAAVP